MLTKMEQYGQMQLFWEAFHGHSQKDLSPLKPETTLREITGAAGCGSKRYMHINPSQDNSLVGDERNPCCNKKSHSSYFQPSEECCLQEDEGLCMNALGDVEERHRPGPHLNQ